MMPVCCMIKFSLNNSPVTEYNPKDVRHNNSIMENPILLDEKMDIILINSDVINMYIEWMAR